MNKIAQLRNFEAYRLINRFPIVSHLYQQLGASQTLRPIIWKIKELDNRRYGTQRRKFYAQFIKRGDLVFDIGANIGNRTDIFIALGARVVAVEPQKHCVEYLRNKYKKTSQATIVPKAAGKTKGKQTLFLSGADATSSMSTEWIHDMKKGRYPNLNWNEKSEVETTTLDELIITLGKPVFCKIDVEGYELEVLKGLNQPIPFVSFEFFPERMKIFISCLNILTKLGKYTFNYALGENPHLELSKWQSKNEIIATIQSLPTSAQGDIYCKIR